jgi:glycosyltransferase involved in cell wall biosynthesis
VGGLAETLPAQQEQQITAARRLAIVPALNEERSVASVIAEIRELDPDFEILVIDDGSKDGTFAEARRAGASVVSLPYNLGIGGAVQTGYQYARDNGFDVAVQVDGDGQHDARDIPALLEPILAGKADLVIGTRFRGDRIYRAPFARRIGIRLLAAVVSVMVRQRMTDPTSGFRGANKRAIRLFAVDYPRDYPEAEANVLVHRHGMKMIEVPVAMRTRTGGRSSITVLRSLYYMVKVCLALLISMFRRYRPREDL